MQRIILVHIGLNMTSKETSLLLFKLSTTVVETIYLCLRSTLTYHVITFSVMSYFDIYHWVKKYHCIGMHAHQNANLAQLPAVPNSFLACTISPLHFQTMKLLSISLNWNRTSRKDSNNKCHSSCAFPTPYSIFFS